MKEKIAQYLETLDDDKKDERCTTDREDAADVFEGFLKWLERGKPKFCIECNHFHEYRQGRPTFKVWRYCKKYVTHHPVTGAPLYPTCMECRGENGYCGPEGVAFERR